MAKVKVGIVQMSCVADKKANVDKAIIKIKEAAQQGAQIVCLQEMFNTLYFCDVEDYENFKLGNLFLVLQPIYYQKLRKKIRW